MPKKVLYFVDFKKQKFDMFYTYIVCCHGLFCSIDSVPLNLVAIHAKSKIFELWPAKGLEIETGDELRKESYFDQMPGK